MLEPGSTRISTVYCFGSESFALADLRSGRRHREATKMKITPMIALGTPTAVIVHMPMRGIVGSVRCDSIIRPRTTRFVLVPISVQVPPSTAA